MFREKHLRRSLSRLTEGATSRCRKEEEEKEEERQTNRQTDRGSSERVSRGQERRMQNESGRSVI